MVKKIGSACGGIVFILFFFLITVNCNEIQSPDAFVETPVFIFDPVPEGKILTHHFVIQNKGVSDLIVEAVKTG